MKKILTRKLNPRTHNAAIVVLRMNKGLDFCKTRNSQNQTYKGEGVNSKGAVSIFLVMSVLAAVLAIALGSSFIISSEIRSSMDSSESAMAYCVSESGMEQALYDKVKLGREPRGNRCAGNCPSPACVDWGTDVCTETALGLGASYCIEVTETDLTGCDSNTITSIKSIGEYKSMRRSIEIAF